MTCFTRFTLSLLLAAASASYALPAHALVRSQASVHDFTISLVDLAPDDGLTPWIRFAGEGERPLSGMVTGRVSITDTSDDHDIYTEYFNNAGAIAPFSDASGEAHHGATSSYASLTVGPSMLGPHHALVSGTAQAPSPGTRAAYFATTSAPSYYSQTFEVSANTAVTFSGNVEVFATVDRDAFDAAALAYVEMMSWGFGPNGVPGTSQFVRDKADIGATAGQFRSVTKQMSLSFRNESARAITGQFNLTAYANGHDIAAPVPEPGLIALCLAGLGTVGVVARRRQGRDKCRSTLPA